MASVPCDGHGTKRPGRLCGCYLALLTDGIRLKAYKRFCSDCCHELLARHGKDWVDQALDRAERTDAACHFCGEVVPTEADLSRFYSTVYIDGKSRRDYTSLYCPKCAEGIRSEFDLATA
jgi:hypothetical protein